MRFFFPDSQDQVSPSYDFVAEEYSPYRVRQRDDLYAHEVLTQAPYDGMLVSKAIVDGSVNGAGKYSEAQRSRLYRYGVQRFFRLPVGVEALGDCGAFNYVNESEPPYTVAEVVDFYEGCGFDSGVSVDHVVLAYDRKIGLADAPDEWSQRRLISLRYAEEFLAACEARGRPFEPVGAAQGWDPTSYADSVRLLQGMGYRRIALGGMVPLKTRDILDSLAAVSAVRRTDVSLHLLGVARVTAMHEFRAFGVDSFDSTSPFRQAFMDDRDNYYSTRGHYTAIRIPQVDANAALKRRILSGEIDQRTAVLAESACLAAVRAVTKKRPTVDAALEALAAYESLLALKKTYIPEYERTLEDRPWAACRCQVCRDYGVEIAIFRGTERNKRRGFHNLSVFSAQVRALPVEQEEVA
jgi:hypothetical protein